MAEERLTVIDTTKIQSLNETQHGMTSMQHSQKQTTSKNFSPKQELWQRRSRLLWRLKGMEGTLYHSQDIITQSERIQLNAAFGLIADVLHNFTKSSKELGFNAKERCSFYGCNRPAVEGSGYCAKHQQEMIPDIEIGKIPLI